MRILQLSHFQNEVPLGNARRPFQRIFQQGLTSIQLRAIEPYVRFACFCLIALSTFLFRAPLQAEDQEIEFGRDIRPILSNHCFQCHGADEETREAGLRLDVRASALEAGAIQLTSPGESELLKRVHSRDQFETMPPPEANKPLTDSQVKLLERWIQQGANYSEHWAFQTVERPQVPPEIKNEWCRNEIDAFVLQKLQKAGFVPSPEAQKTTLIRRVYQDLLGLLPSPEEVDQFLQDQSPDAYSKLVDRLLSSPHYGERWGRHWLDQARYADSNGYTIDGPRVMWPYRDWVISALNRDLPFDQFTIEQLAGDLLPNPTKDQLVATAFHRNTMINQEGGVKADQYRNEALIDRTNTTGAVWLGLTMGCAQCHSHKFDPITHDEYYRLYAFFNDAADANNTGPTVDVHEQEMFQWTSKQYEQLAELNAARKQVASLQNQLKDETGLESVDWNWSPAAVSHHETRSGTPLTLLSDGSLLAKEKLGAHDQYQVQFELPQENVETGTELTAIRLRVLPDESLPKKGPGTAGNGNFVLTDLSLRIGEKIIPFDRAWADHSQPGFAISRAIDDDQRSGWAINVDGAQTKAGKRMNTNHEAVFTLLKPVHVAPGESVEVLMKHDLHADYHVGRFAFDVSSVMPPAQPDQAEIKTELATLKQNVKQLEAVLPGGGKPVKQMVVRAQSTPPETYRLIRGDFLDPDKESGALAVGVPASLVESIDAPQFSNRLDLARWLVSRDNPLTARVTVNRIWSKYFGRGLVETENDFGFQSSIPTHPELLDWLAASFMENGWSLKELHRKIVTSATYRQSSDLTDELRSRDPRNELLARQSRFRVEAEVVRDLALSASGLLTPEVGGPSVHPPQPDGIYSFTQTKKSWPTETGPDRYRRTMYTMFYRSAPYPLLSTFDAPDFSTTCTQRVRSNTPLQSLTMANDLVFQEFAIGLAKRVQSDASLKNIQERVNRMILLALTRLPDSSESDVLIGFYQREIARYQSNPEQAQAFIQEQATGDEAVQLAALASLARVILNTDEFVTRN